MAEERAALIEEARRQAEELARIAAEKAEEERKAAEDLDKAQNAINGAADSPLTLFWAAPHFAPLSFALSWCCPDDLS